MGVPPEGPVLPGSFKNNLMDISIFLSNYSFCGGLGVRGDRCMRQVRGSSPCHTPAFEGGAGGMAVQNISDVGGGGGSLPGQEGI